MDTNFGISQPLQRWCQLGKRDEEEASPVCCWRRCSRCTTSADNPTCHLQAGGAAACCTEQIQTNKEECTTAWDTGCLIPPSKPLPNVRVGEVNCAHERYGCCPQTSRNSRAVERPHGREPWQALIATVAANVSFALRAPAEALQVDVPRLQHEARLAMAAHPPVTHWGTRHDGNWFSTCLRCVGGKMDEVGSDKEGQDYRWTEAAKLTPYTRSLVSKLAISWKDIARVRYSMLTPDSLISWHEDGFKENKHWIESTARIHIVVSSPPGAYSVIGGETHVWKNGDLTLGHYGFPHYVYNGNKQSNRTHLLIDVRAGSSRSRARLERFFGNYIMRPGLPKELKAQTIATLKSYVCAFPSPIAQHRAQLEALRSEFGDGVPAVRDMTVQVAKDECQRVTFSSPASGSTRSIARGKSSDSSSKRPARGHGAHKAKQKN